MMKSPLTGKEMLLKRESRVLTFRKEEFSVVYHYFLCEQSGETFTSTELDQINLQQLHNQYLQQHNLPFPEEIRQIRERYALSATKMSEILGFGVNSYRNYELGEVPNLSNGKLIQLAADPRKFQNLIELSESLTSDFKEKLRIKAESLTEAEVSNYFATEYIEYLFNGEFADEFSGYRKPNMVKLAEMVVYFAAQLNPWKTQLNKLLFYADFLMFKRSCFSISGARYRAINMGPVPTNYNSLYEYIANQNDIDILVYDFGGEEFKPKPDRQFNPSVFSGQELEVLQQVVERFAKIATKSAPTSELVEISHKERAWLDNAPQRKLISYKYAFDLSQI